MEAMGDCSAKSIAVNDDSFEWTDWKAMLNAHFVLPQNLRIKYYYVFEERRENLRTLFIKKYSKSPEWTVFNVLKSGVTAEEVLRKMTLANADKFGIPIAALRGMKGMDKKQGNSISLMSYVSVTTKAKLDFEVGTLEVAWIGNICELY